MIQVTKPFIPDRKTLDQYLDGICERAWLTNNGPLVQELTQRLEDYLGVQNLLLVANGTLALQVAYKALGVHREAVTTPFTFVATASSMHWQGIKPRFADIDPGSLNLSPETAEQTITADTDALVPVHVYGRPCDVESLDRIAQARNIRVIYDASHTFGVDYQGESILNWGDASTLSFHATKLFHTVEGGGIVFREREQLERAQHMINFGQSPEMSDIDTPGLNAKMSEVHAAFGLANLDCVDQILEIRRSLAEEYRKHLPQTVQLPPSTGTNNGAYMPILLPSEAQAGAVESALLEAGIKPRRYFSPSLQETTLLRGEQQPCPVTSDVSRRVICLPIYPDMASEQIRQISETIDSTLRAV